MRVSSPERAVRSAPGSSPQLIEAGDEVIGTHENEPEAVVPEAAALANAKVGRAGTTTTTRPTPARLPEADSGRRGLTRQDRAHPKGAGDGA
jgi:hypothetical protein